MDNKTKSIIQAMDKHADVLEARSERHVYGAARIHMILLDERISKLEAERDKYKAHLILSEPGWGDNDVDWALKVISR